MDHKRVDLWYERIEESWVLNENHVFYFLETNRSSQIVFWKNWRASLSYGFISLACRFRGRRGILRDVLKIDGSLPRNIDFEVANFQVLRKTRRKT